MKINSLIFTLLLLSVCGQVFPQAIVITDDATYTTGHASSVLDVKSTTKGLLIPRLTQAERNAIGSPAGGLMIYQTDNSPGFYYYNGSTWTTVGQAPDGSETKVNSGASINITGSGTQAAPYTPAFRTQSVTQAQRIAISSPFTGQIVWCSDCGASGEMQLYNGSSWTNWCGSTPAPVLPTVTTTAVSSVAGTTASSGGNVTSDGGGTVTARGVCWSTSSSPTIANSKTTDGSGSGSFTSSITGLSYGTLYYVRAYATNSTGTSYGNEITFTTFNLPSLSTYAISSVTGTTASSGGNVTSDGGVSVTVRGVCWSTSTSPTTANSLTSNGGGTGSFVSSITGLSNGTTYYVRAYATNAAGTAYGNQVSLTTLTVPTVTTTAVYSIAQTDAYSGGNVTSDGGASISQKGVCWSTSPNPTIANSLTYNGLGTGVYLSYLSGLTAGTTYYVRAYATNSVGTSYGTEVNFTTLNVPTLTTTEITSITNSTASSGGTISSTGGAAITARGVCWSTTPNPTVALATKTTDAASNPFTSSITGLSSGTLYYVRAYATNSQGTGYGQPLTFTTSSPTVPSLTTTAVTSVKAFTASSGGDISSDGGAAITARGVCWSTSPNPTVDLTSKTTDAATDPYNSSITGLGPLSTFYLRAYATNSIGTGYGNEVTFTTPDLAAGDSYQGGIIAYILQFSDVGYQAGATGGIIAATADQSAGAEWGCYLTNISGAERTNVGGGSANTDDIEAVCTTDGIAADLCANLNSGGYTDWYLPSKDELNKLTTIKSSIGMTSGTYWSSSEQTFNPGANAWTQLFSDNSTTPAAKNSSYKVRAVRSILRIGDAYQGGIIYYILKPGDPGYDPNVTHGLIALTYDWGATSWGCRGTIICGAYGTAIGTGSSNTQAIDLNCTASSIAADVCWNSTANGYSDWYLPSKDELNKLYPMMSTVGGFSTTYYWSSSEYNNNNAWTQNFGTGVQSYADKNQSYRVRPIRKF